MREFSDHYLSILKGPMAGLNLTRILDPDEFYQKQIVDSLIPLNYDENFKKALEKDKFLFDIGFGGGFPLLPLAKSYPDLNFVGLEARRKKAEAVYQIAQELSLNNVKTFHMRIEEVLFDRAAVITFKAVGKVTDYLLKINSKVSIKAFFYKGPQFDELEGKDKLPEGWKLESREDIELPGTLGRVILGYKYTPVPRGTNKRVKKNLVNVTELI